MRHKRIVSNVRIAYSGHIAATRERGPDHASHGKMQFVGIGNSERRLDIVWEDGTSILPGMTSASRYKEDGPKAS